MTLLKIDLDIKPSKEWLKDWIRTRKMILWSELIRPSKVDIFETSKGLHIYFTVPDKLDDEEINRLQFLLGDDHTRVKINQWRIEHKVKGWNKLFSKVYYRKKSKFIECWYCGNKIPVGVNNADTKKV